MLLLRSWMSSVLCPCLFLSSSYVWEPPHSTQGDYLASEEFTRVWGFKSSWKLSSQRKGQTPWCISGPCNLAPVPFLLLLCLAQTFSSVLVKFFTTPSFLLLFFLSISIVWNVPFSPCSQVICILPSPKAQFKSHLLLDGNSITCLLGTRCTTRHSYVHIHTCINTHTPNQKFKAIL